MAKNASVHQYAPLRTPSNWSAEERKLIVQLEDLFGDLYKKFNRINLKDLSPDLQSKIGQALTDVEDFNVNTGRMENAFITNGEVANLDAGDVDADSVSADSGSIATLISTHHNSDHSTVDELQAINAAMQTLQLNNLSIRGPLGVYYFLRIDETGNLILEEDEDAGSIELPPEKCPHGIGDILTTINPTSPSDRWPGTSWQPMEQGRFLMNAGPDNLVGTKGGANAHAINIARTNLPAIPIIPAGVVPYIYGGGLDGYMSKVGFGAYSQGSPNGFVNHNIAGNMGDGTPINLDNRPLYEAVYRWLRTG